MSSHYEKRLEQDLAVIRGHISHIANLIEDALEGALAALKGLDKPLANRIIIKDNVINRLSEEIDKVSHYFVARHLPSAGHLRFISSVLRMNIGLERIGDYAVTICREVIQLKQPLDSALTPVADRMAHDSFKMLDQAVQAFLKGDAESATLTMGYAENVDRSFASIFEELVNKGQNAERTTKDLFSFLAIFNMLERVSDQAKNICEETVFAVTGKTKKRKPVRILFLDRQNGPYGHSAVAIGRKAFPASGRYSRAGLEAEGRLDETFIAFIGEHGHNPHEEKPRAVEWFSGNLDKFHLVVSLDGPVEDYLAELPFHTVALEWEMPPLPPADGEEKRAAYETIYKELSFKIRDLMETMRGEEAS